MKSKLLFLILIICTSNIILSCTKDFYLENSIAEYQVKVILPDSFLYFSDLDITEILEDHIGDNNVLVLHSELYELTGLENKRIEKYNSEFGYNSGVLDSYSLKSNTTYQLLYYLEIQGESDSFYDKADLRDLKLKSERNTIATGLNKECFIGEMKLQGGFEGYCDSIVLKSPFSFFELHPTDIESYLKNSRHLADSIYVRLEYLGFYPISFDISINRPSASINDAIINNRVSLSDLTSYSEYLISDFIFMSGPQSAVDVRVTLSSVSDFSELISISEIKIKLEHGKRFRVSKPFFTGNKDGIEIDTSFNDDIIIPI